MDYIFGTAIVLTLMNTSWSSSVMVNSSTTQTLQGLFLAQNINPDIYGFEGNLQESILDFNKVDIFTRIAEINKNFGSSMSLEYGDIATGGSKNAIKCLYGPRSCLWPRSRDGIVYVPYTLDRAFSKTHETIIYNAMKEFDTLTCVKFAYRRHQKNYIKIIAGSGCWANVGHNSRVQITSLQVNGCINRGIIQHELLHILGFHHEQNRNDRDEYVTILLDNVINEARYNFRKINTNNLGAPYDYTSVMHYGRTAFSNDGESSTIIPKPDPDVVIGQRFGMSSLDIQKVNKLYKCNRCGGLLSTNNGQLNSPGFPNLYLNDLNCKWLIRSPDYDNKIYLQFTTFQVKQFLNCYSDRVIIYDGDNPLFPVLDGPNCGAENPAVVSSGTALLVEFYTTHLRRAKGFSANFQFVDCGSTMTKKADIIDFIAWKQDETAIKCFWALLVPRAFKIVFTLTALNLDKHNDCEMNYLAIHDIAAFPPKLFAKYCGPLDSPVTFTSTGRTIVLELIHLNPNLGWGFSAEYKSIKNKNPPVVITYKNDGNRKNTFAVVPHILLTYAVLYFCIFPYF
ncbi:astacin-like metalloendopeptidase [Rhinoraja longicauda]